jgi:acyl-CoA synthetase (AMP-forming)/AMP-acid ligase II
VPDEVLGDVGVAVVVGAPGATPALDELRAHCRAVLADYKAPDALVVVDELPLTPMMKVDPVRLGILAERGAETRRAGMPGTRRGSPRGARQ